MDKSIIEKTALDLFKKHTYDEVKVSDICRACGITKPTFYHYVASKDDLLVTYYDQAVERMAEALSEVSDGQDPWEQLEACFGVLMDETERIGAELLGRIISINIQLLWCIRKGQTDWRANFLSGLHSMLQVS